MIVVFAVVTGLVGLIYLTKRANQPHTLFFIAAIIMLGLVLVSHNAASGAFLFVKIALTFGSFIFALNHPKATVALLAAIVLIDSVSGILIYGWTKLTALPSIALILLASLCHRTRSLFWLLVFGAMGFMLLNFLYSNYRTEVFLLGSILAALLLTFVKRESLIRYFLFIPYVVAATFSFFGSYFSVGHEYVVLLAQNIEGTASNFERSVLSYSAFSELVTHPLGRSFTGFSEESATMASYAGRQLYDDRLVDPHNFVSFFTAHAGIVGLGLYTLLILSSYRILHAVYLQIPITAMITLLPLAAIAASLFPFSTEPRLIFAVSMGAMLGMSGKCWKKVQFTFGPRMAGPINHAKV